MPRAVTRRWALRVLCIRPQHDQWVCIGMGTAYNDPRQYLQNIEIRCTTFNL